MLRDEALLSEEMEGQALLWVSHIRVNCLSSFCRGKERRREGEEERWKNQHYFVFPPSDTHSLTKLFKGVLRSLNDHLLVVRRPHWIANELQFAPLLQNLYRKLSITPLCDTTSVCVCVCVCVCVHV